MQVWDQVAVKNAAKGDEESQGRAGVVQKVEGPSDDPKQRVHVMLDETETHEAGLVEYAQEDLTFLGR